MAYEYNGDQATFSPDRTPELLTNFSNQFVQRDRERRAQKDAQQKAEQDRQIRLQSYVGTRLNAKDFEPPMQGKLNQSLTDIQQKIKEGVPEIEIMAMADSYAGNMQLMNGKIKNTDGGLKEALAGVARVDKDVDLAGLASLAKINAYKKQDQNGNWVAKSPEEIDDTKDYVTEAYNNHWFELYPVKSSAAALTTAVDKEPLQELNTPSKFDDRGNIIERGVKGKIAPALVKYNVGADGKTSYEVHSENYKLPNDKNDLIDDRGQPIKVIAQPLFEKYYNGAIGAAVEAKVRKELGQADFNGSGESSFSPDSEYADMLRKKYMLEVMNGAVQNKFIINTEDSDKESRAIKESLRKEEREAERVRISQSQLGIAERSMRLRELKAQDGDNVDDNDIPPFLETVVNSYGVDIEIEDKPKSVKENSWYEKNTTIPATYKKVKIIPETADQRDLDIVAGKMNNLNQRPTALKTFTLKNGSTIKGYEYDPATGNAYGEKGAVINKNSVQEGFVQHLKASTIKTMSNVGNRDAKAPTKTAPANDPLGIFKK